MKESIREFIEDYREATRVSSAFWKKHWKGMVLIEVVGIAAVIATPVVIEGVVNLKDKIKAKKNNEVQEEEEAKEESETLEETEKRFKVLKGRRG